MSCPTDAGAEEKGEGDYWVDEKGHQVHLSESRLRARRGNAGQHGMLQEGRSLYDAANIT
jgi:preprotein translocase subunit SecA